VPALFIGILSKSKPTRLASGLAWKRPQNLLCSPELARADGTPAATAVTTTVLDNCEHHNNKLSQEASQKSKDGLAVMLETSAWNA
jgi:hypothetical protein